MAAVGNYRRLDFHVACGRLVADRDKDFLQLDIDVILQRERDMCRRPVRAWCACECRGIRAGRQEIYDPERASHADDSQDDQGDQATAGRLFLKRLCVGICSQDHTFAKNAADNAY